MKRLMMASGIIILIVGILLAAITVVSLPENKTEAYQVPKSIVIVDRFGLLGPTFGVTNPTADWGDGFTFNKGDYLKIQVNVTSVKSISFFVDDGRKGLNSNLDSTIYLSYPNITKVNIDWVVPKNSSYNFVFSSSGTVAASDVHWQIVKLWNETDYRTVTQNVPLLPLPMLYVGVGIALSGLAIMVYVIIKNLVRETFPQASVIER